MVQKECIEKEEKKLFKKDMIKLAKSIGFILIIAIISISAIIIVYSLTGIPPDFLVAIVALLILSGFVGYIIQDMYRMSLRSRAYDECKAKEVYAEIDFVEKQKEKYNKGD